MKILAFELSSPQRSVAVVWARSADLRIGATTNVSQKPTKETKKAGETSASFPSLASVESAGARCDAFVMHEAIEAGRGAGGGMPAVDEVLRAAGLERER